MASLLRFIRKENPFDMLSFSRLGLALVLGANPWLRGRLQLGTQALSADAAAEQGKLNMMRELGEMLALFKGTPTDLPRPWPNWSNMRGISGWVSSAQGWRDHSLLGCSYQRRGIRYDSRL